VYIRGMTVSSQQFTYLNAMGINLWQRKNLPEEQQNEHTLVQNNIPAHKKSDVLSADLLSIDLNTLQSHSLFQNIITALNISFGEITATENTLNLGLFNWQMQTANHTNSTGFNFENNILTTPSLDVLIAKPAAKKQLWQLFIHHNLL
jgi:DNA polymerase III psi subunit